MFNKSFKAILLCTLLLLASVINAAQTVTFFHNDISGSPLMATDDGGNVVWKENYYPYGDRLKNQEGQQVASTNNKYGLRANLMMRIPGFHILVPDTITLYWADSWESTQQMLI